MDTYKEDEAVTREELWRAWVQTSKRRDAAAARKLKVVGGLVVGLVAAAVYLVLVRQAAI